MSDQLPAGHPRSLEGYTRKRVAHFLRFLYHPTEVTAIDFHLPGAAWGWRGAGGGEGVWRTVVAAGPGCCACAAASLFFPLAPVLATGSLVAWSPRSALCLHTMGARRHAWPPYTRTLRADAACCPPRCPAGAAKSLSACARLANALEVPQLLDELDARMEETGGHPGMRQGQAALRRPAAQWLPQWGMSCGSTLVTPAIPHYPAHPYLHSDPHPPPHPCSPFRACS